jgi:hypothetical protein
MANKRQLTYIRKHSYIHIYSIEICIPTNPSKLQNKKYIIQSYSPVKALRKTTSILKNGHDQQVYTIEMKRTETTANNKPPTDRETSRL